MQTPSSKEPYSIRPGREVFDAALDWRVEDSSGQFICECASKETAQLIARALNALDNPWSTRMRRYTALSLVVHDADGTPVCSCRDARTAQLIADALNSARPPPGGSIFSDGRLKGARLEWLDASLLDDPDPSQD